MYGDRNNPPAETATHQDEIDGTSQRSLIPSAVNNATTLLPSRLASAVSFLAQSTSLTVRIGTLFGGAALGSARVTTLTGLELSRALVETILTKAGRDVVGQAQDEYGKVEAESILERSLAALHATVTSTSFFASAGFHLSEAALTSVSNLSQNLLYTLDAILGSTESSRAIAAIITLIRKEFSREGNVNNSELVGVGDLLVGSVGFALLQRWGQPNSERRMRETAGEVIIWDVVILDNGLRADVIGTQSTQYMHNMLNDAEGDVSRPASFMDPGGNQASIDALERVSPYPENSLQPPNTTTSIHPQLSDEEIQAYITRQLPQGTRVSIRSEVVTARTITVDVYDENEVELAAPPGTMVVEERFHHDQDSQHMSKRLPKHTIVFRTAFNESSDTDVRTAGSDLGTSFGNRTLPYEVDTDIPSSNHDDKSCPENSQPQTTEVHANEGRRRPRRNPSSSSLSGSETPKLSFGKAPFSKITQKVRPSLGEKPSSQKDVTKKASKKVSSILPRPSNKPGDHESPRKSSENVTSSPLPPSKNTGIRAPTPASLNRALPPPPPTNRYTRYRSTPSPTASRLLQPNRGAAVAEGLSIERDGESFVTPTDSFSVHSIESRPGSASYKRTHIRSSSSLSCTRRTQPQNSPKSDSHPPEQYQDLRRTRSFVPSIYSIATGSETSLILAPRPRKSVYEDESTIIGLNRNGLVPGIFPHNHLVKNIRRFCRFSSASYGSNAMRMMGVQHDPTAIAKYDDENQEHSSFSNMTGLPASAILLSSFVDPAGGSNAAGETESGFPLVHYLFLDHESKAIVLALRGTWGFEDILTDMTCDYDDLEWQGKNWKVHKGMHASAKRLLEGGGQRVMATIKASLEEFPEYGVIFCGHSLGGGVAALLATMISQPRTTVSGPSFVTATALQATAPLLLTASHQQETARRFSLPPDRPIHVYAFGPPACMSPFLRRATRGLVTTVVNGKDVVPHLSLGILHDLRVVALSFKKDASNSKSHIRTRVWEGLRQSIVNKFYVSQTPPISSPYGGGKYIGEEDTWAWSTLQSLREEMTAPKLVPPGEVFVVETMRVLQRNPFTARPSPAEAGGHPHLGRPATRVQLKFIRDVETYFSELKFSSGMLGDHNPARYEANLAALAKGIIDE